MEEKRFEHDCKTCVYLGRHEKYDLYLCDGISPLARYGNEESEYVSGLTCSFRGESFSVEPLCVARELALEKGLVNQYKTTGI